MPHGGIRTHDLSRRAAADLRLRPGGHWDRLNRQVSASNPGRNTDPPPKRFLDSPPFRQHGTDIGLVGAELLHADGRTDMTKLTVAFRNFRARLKTKCKRSVKEATVA